MKAEAKQGGNFDGVAPYYDALAWLVFGQRLKQAQALFLDEIPANASVLIVGGGTGWLLEQVLTRCQPQRVIYLEASARMLARASRRMMQHALIGTVDFRVGEETSLTSEDRADVVLTPFVLDLFTAETLQTQFIPRLNRVLKPGGLWLVTDFIQPAKGWQRTLLWTMIRFFQLTAGIQTNHLADWQKCLADADLKRKKQQWRVSGMVSAEVWQVL